MPPQSTRTSSGPTATVPYVIDSDLSDLQRQNVESAIAEWNDKTVISLVARTAEANYVRFRNIAVGNCRSRVGMVGGEQAIGFAAWGMLGQRSRPRDRPCDRAVARGTSAWTDGSTSR